MSRMFQEEKEFWGPVAIALGLAAWSISSIIFTMPINGWIAVGGLVWIIGGLVWIAIGLLLLFLLPRKNLKLLLSRTLIVAGIPILFIGARIVSPKLIMLITGWSIIAVAVICIVSGLYIMCSVYKK